MGWIIDYFPPCRHHVFLSHSREDHDTLVRPVYERLVAAGVAPWIDRHHYPYGRDSRSALQASVLDCRHVVFFVTPAMLASPRGWCVLELGYAEILQSNLHAPGEPLAHLFLPLFFVPQSDAALPRTVWQAVRDRGAFHDPTRTPDALGWATDEICQFLRREERLASNWKARARRDADSRDALSTTNGLRQRVTHFAPVPLPTNL